MARRVTLAATAAVHSVAWCCRRRWRAVLLVSVTLLVLRTGVRGGHSSDSATLRRSVAVLPARLARALADFTQLTHAMGITGPWSVESEAVNVTAWWYSAHYRCGERCRAVARVAAHEPRATSTEPYRVDLELHECFQLPLLPWLQFCDELSVRAEVSSSGGGARYVEQATERCSWARSGGAEGGALCGGGGLAARRAAALLRLEVAAAAGPR